MKKLNLDIEMKDYAAKNSWHAKMTNSGGLDSYDNYIGQGYGDKVVVLCRSRDSDDLAESNFECALKRLGRESKHVEVSRDGHWGCGWIELILVNPKSKKHLKIAYQIHKDLERYPVLDEDDFYERENESFRNYADGAKKDLAKALTQHFGMKNGKALENLAYDLNMECQHYAGSDSCINIYTGRAPDARDIERLKNVMEQMKYNNTLSTRFKELAAKIGLDLRKAA